MSSSLSTRRGFVTAASFGVVSLYGLWAALGAAPSPWGAGVAADHVMDGDAHATMTAPPEPAGHGGHGGGSATGDLAMDEFRARVAAFVARHGLPDGSVRVARAEAATDPHASHGSMAKSEPASAGPVDVYLMAYQWGFEPVTLRLEAGVPYRFRMMAVDSSHGATIRVGPSSRVIRLRRGALVEQELTFTRAGEYLVYCTVYCGIGHDRMAGRIIAG